MLNDHVAIDKVCGKYMLDNNDMSSSSVAIKPSDAMGFINMGKGFQAQCTEIVSSQQLFNEYQYDTHCHLVQLYGVDTWKEVVLGVIEILLHQWYRYLLDMTMYNHTNSSCHNLHHATCSIHSANNETTFQ